jgi:hypothetical protein
VNAKAPRADSAPTWRRPSEDGLRRG